MVVFNSARVKRGNYILNTVIQHVEQNLTIYVLAVVIIAPLLYLFRKQAVPVIYHSIEYAIYCSVFHFFLGGLLRVGSWYRSETSFRNTDGSLAKEFKPFTTPLNWHFWEKELYQPQAVFYVEAVAALLILYVVIFIRPTRFRRNVYKRNTETPQKTNKKAVSAGDPGYTSRMRTDAHRARLQKIRENR